MSKCVMIRRVDELVKTYDEPEQQLDDYPTDSDDDEMRCDMCDAQSASSSDDDASDDETSMESVGSTTESNNERPSCLRSKSGFTWSTTAPLVATETTGTALNRRGEHTAAPKSQALQIQTPLDAWSLLITDEIINTIVIRTNKQIDHNRRDVKDDNKNSYDKHTDPTEIKSLFGMFYYAGLFNVNRTTINDLWSGHSYGIFRATMTQRRIQCLINALRFDKKSTRSERKKSDKFACIRNVWEKFVKNCRDNYEPSDDCTIDDNTLLFDGKCSFKFYSPKKPNECGLKIFGIRDSQTNYMFDAVPHVGNIDEQNDDAISSHYVQTLCKTIYNTGRTVTTEKSLTSVGLVKKMRDKFNLTMVGKISKNKTEIPSSFKRRPSDGSNSQFCYNDDMTLVSYNPKKRKIVIVLSSLHRCGLTNPRIDVPEIVLYHERTKTRTAGVDRTFDDCTTARRTARWPMRIMYHILDSAIVNAHVLYSLCASNELLQRREFMLNLSVSLIRPQLALRLTIPNLSFSLRSVIEEFVEYDDRPEEQDPLDIPVINRLEKRKRCSLCSYSVDRKTRYFCVRCRRAMCNDHTSKVCVACADNV